MHIQILVDGFRLSKDSFKFFQTPPQQQQQRRQQPLENKLAHLLTQIDLHDL